MNAQQQSQAPSNSAAVWFSRIMWLGILFNLFFVLEQVLSPGSVNLATGLTPDFPMVWNQAHGVMVLALSILYIPAALSPLQFPAYSWLTVLSRLLAAIFWAWCVQSGQGNFASYLYTDGGFCVVLAVLLQRALPKEDRLPANVKKLFADIGARLKAAYQSTAVRVVTGLAVVVAGAAGWMRSPRITSTGRSDWVRPAASPTGSSKSFRIFLPISCRGPAATPRWA